MLIEIIITFLGIVVGLLLARFTKEELKQGKKYFIWLKRTILIFLVTFLFYLALPNYISTIIFFIIGLIVAYFFKKEYFYFGLALFSTLNLFTVILIFLFGLPYGSLLFSKKYKYKTLLFDLVFFAIPFLLLFVKIPNNFILAFTSGALFTLIFKVNKK
ncbi:MAG: hypothetical protein ABIJ20_02185 [Nanoarchaeota archaeon]|nr:hypothetical protein [Nanoarchaeota archaeon]MBU1445269.1 hypothetical protein [Nanoarchaeota archaeon]MBU2420465.1 hypothetical protein [Nanoarchaeota archaeon]MBU2475109.1 hypothetical protein [Nanoarchaeota archaeon]